MNGMAGKGGGDVGGKSRLGLGLGSLMNNGAPQGKGVQQFSQAQPHQMTQPTVATLTGGDYRGNLEGLSGPLAKEAGQAGWGGGMTGTLGSIGQEQPGWGGKARTQPLFGPMFEQRQALETKPAQAPTAQAMPVGAAGVNNSSGANQAANAFAAKYK